MTKAEIVSNISDKLGVEKNDVQAIVNHFMKEVKGAQESGENVYLRGFGSFVIKTRKAKKGRNISKNVTIDIPAHNIPSFKPAKEFLEQVKTNVAVK
jgi:DNA-binding protein HU-beta